MWKVPWYYGGTKGGNRVASLGLGVGVCYLGYRIKAAQQCLVKNAMGASCFQQCCSLLIRQFSSSVREVLRHDEFLHGVRISMKQASNNAALWIPL